MSDVAVEASRAARAWLWKVLEETGENPTSLAKRIGMAVTTLSRVARSNPDEDPPHELSLGTIAKISQVTGIAPPRLELIETTPLRELRETDAAPYRAETADKSLAGKIETLIDGRNAADVWEIRSRSLELRGVIPGDLVIVDLNAEAVDGDIVCAQVYDLRAPQKADTIFRIYAPPFLISASMNERHWKPLLVDSDRVVIKGVATDLYRPRRGGKRLIRLDQRPK